MREIRSVYCEVGLTNSKVQSLSLRRASLILCGIYSGQTGTGIGFFFPHASVLLLSRGGTNPPLLHTRVHLI
jgi:hypothetical protein